MALDTPTLQTLQLVSYASLTSASLIVAGVSSYTAFRQHRGWKPIVFVTLQARSQSKSGSHLSHELFLNFEVWNRRKYPIAIESITVEFSRFTYLDMPGLEKDDEGRITLPSGNKPLWFRHEQESTTHPSTLLASNEHTTAHIDAPYQLDEKFSGVKEHAHIRVRYFDPIKNTYLILKSQRIYL